MTSMAYKGTMSRIEQNRTSPSAAFHDKRFRKVLSEIRTKVSQRSQSSLQLDTVIHCMRCSRPLSLFAFSCFRCLVIPLFNGFQPTRLPLSGLKDFTQRDPDAWQLAFVAERLMYILSHMEERNNIELPFTACLQGTSFLHLSSKQALKGEHPPGFAQHLSQHPAKHFKSESSHSTPLQQRCGH